MAKKLVITKHEVERLVFDVVPTAVVGEDDGSRGYGANLRLVGPVEGLVHTTS